MRGKVKESYRWKAGDLTYRRKGIAEAQNQGGTDSRLFMKSLQFPFGSTGISK